jgi:predicted RNA-binding Zn-ribbon protein involved in translation (DUF1610 family)
MHIARFACPACGQHIESDVATVATGLACPSCGKNFLPHQCEHVDDQTGQVIPMSQLSQMEILEALKAGLDAGTIRFRVKVTVGK